MNKKKDLLKKNNESKQRLLKVYNSEKPRLLARLRAVGRTLEQAEDLVHDVFTEMVERVRLIPSIRNLPAWIYLLLKRRLIDLWRHEKVCKKSGKIDVAEEILCEIIAGIGIDPLEGLVQDCLIDALNDAFHELPVVQRKVVEAQVFGGKTFREISEETGVSIDTLKARKRYAIQNLSNALKHWMNE